MKQKFWINQTLPSLNDFIKTNRANKLYGADLKKRYQKDIVWTIKIAKLTPVKQAWFDFLWIEKNKKRDKDNITGGGRKIILDSLVENKIIGNDGWQHVIGWADHFYVKNGQFSHEGVMVCLDDMREIEDSKRKIKPEFDLKVEEFYMNGD